LKVWMSLKEHGIQKYRKLVRQNLQQAQYLADGIKNEAHLELITGLSLNVGCYRYNPGNLADDELNIINKEILMRLHEEGVAAPTYTLLNGRDAIRAAITNHRSKLEDFDILVKSTIRIGNEITS